LQNKLSAKKIQKPLRVVGVESTGHAASPATIVIAGNKKQTSRPTSSDSTSLHVCYFIAVFGLSISFSVLYTIYWLSGRADGA